MFGLKRATEKLQEGVDMLNVNMGRLDYAIDRVNDMVNSSISNENILDRHVKGHMDNMESRINCLSDSMNMLDNHVKGYVSVEAILEGNQLGFLSQLMNKQIAVEMKNGTVYNGTPSSFGISKTYTPKEDGMVTIVFQPYILDVSGKMFPVILNHIETLCIIEDGNAKIIIGGEDQ